MHNEEYYRKMSEYVTYNPESGKMFWNDKYPTPGYQGKEIKGFKNSGGYLRAQFGLQEGWPSRHIPLHRLAVYIMQGPILEGHVVDHINRDRANNRWINLRLATPQENSVNRNIKKSNIHDRMLRWLALQDPKAPRQRCPKCLELKIHLDYSGNASTKRGLAWACKTCITAYKKGRKTMPITTPTSTS